VMLVSIWKCFCSLTENSTELNTKNIVTLLIMCTTTLLNICATLLISQVTQLPATSINPHQEEQGLLAFADEPEDKQLLDKLQELKYLHTNLLIITLALHTDMLVFTPLLQTEELIITLLLIIQIEELVITLAMQTDMLAITLLLQTDMLDITILFQTEE